MQFPKLFLSPKKHVSFFSLTAALIFFLFIYILTNIQHINKAYCLNFPKCKSFFSLFKSQTKKTIVCLDY